MSENAVGISIKNYWEGKLKHFEHVVEKVLFLVKTRWKFSMVSSMWFLENKTSELERVCKFILSSANTIMRISTGSKGPDSGRSGPRERFRSPSLLLYSP